MEEPRSFDEDDLVLMPKKHKLSDDMASSLVDEKPSVLNQTQVILFGQEPHTMSLRGFLPAMAQRSKWIREQVVSFTSRGEVNLFDSLHIGKQLSLASAPAREALLFVWASINGIVTSNPGFDDKATKAHQHAIRHVLATRAAVFRNETNLWPDRVKHRTAIEEAHPMPAAPSIERPQGDVWLHRFAMLQHMRTFIDYFEANVPAMCTWTKWMMDLVDTCPFPHQSAVEADAAHSLLTLSSPSLEAPHPAPVVAGLIHPAREELAAYMEEYATRHLIADKERASPFFLAARFVRGQCAVRTCHDSIAQENVVEWTKTNGLRLIPWALASCFQECNHLQRCAQHTNWFVKLRRTDVTRLVRTATDVTVLADVKEKRETTILYCPDGDTVLRTIRIFYTPEELDIVIRNEPGNIIAIKPSDIKEVRKRDKMGLSQEQKENLTTDINRSISRLVRLHPFSEQQLPGLIRHVLIEDDVGEHNAMEN